MDFNRSYGNIRDMGTEACECDWNCRGCRCERSCSGWPAERITQASSLAALDGSQRSVRAQSQETRKTGL